MLKPLMIIASLLIFEISFGQVAVVPTQYRLIKEVFGDLNRDGVEEKVAVYNMTPEEDNIKGIDRVVIIFRKNKGQWVIWQQSGNAVGNSRDGGMMGDPFEDIEIKKGVLLISQAGGSSWKWRHVDKYKFQNNGFELIGYTSYYGKPCEYWEDFDYNLSTGHIEFQREYERCDDTGSQAIYKKENERFKYKSKNKITLSDRNVTEIKITTPKYKHELYL
jgi:hypothetical protein